jgi:hypothetical protein
MFMSSNPTRGTSARDLVHETGTVRFGKVARGGPLFVVFPRARSWTRVPTARAPLAQPGKTRQKAEFPTKSARPRLCTGVGLCVPAGLDLKVTRKVEAEQWLPRDFAELASKLAGLSYLEPRYLRRLGLQWSTWGCGTNTLETTEEYAD